jgi:hypothetical protein
LAASSSDIKLLTNEQKRNKGPLEISQAIW